MAKKDGGILDEMRNRIRNSGSGKGKMFYLKDRDKKRVRFLSDIDAAVKVPFHDKWGELNEPCRELVGKTCPNHDRDDIRTKDNFAWPVYNYDQKEVQVFLYKANQNSPIPNLIAMYEAYGTITDRDYTISRAGSGTDTTYSLVPLDKGKFKFADKFKALSKKAILELVFKAFKNEDEEEEEDEEDDDEEEEGETPKKGKKKEDKKPAKKGGKKSPPWEEEDDEDEEDDDEDDGEDDDEEDDDEDEEEDDEEDEEPVKKKSSSSKKPEKKDAKKPAKKK